MDGGRVRIPRGTPAVAGFVAVVCGLTAAHSAGAYSIRAIAATPSSIGAGRLWLLVTSGLIVQAPLAISLLSFAALASGVLALCGASRLWVSAALGHVVSTLLTYLVIAAVRAADPAELAGIRHAPDYGVSAISAAWLGVVAAIAWDRRGSAVRERAFIILSCAAIGVFAWMIRGDLTVLDSEHVFAFAIGVVVGGAHPVRGTFRFARSRRPTSAHFG